MTRVIGYRRFGGPEVLEEEECALPPAEAGHVCVRVKAAGINPVDYKLFGGLTRPLEALRTLRTPRVGSRNQNSAPCVVLGRTLLALLLL